jgi:hypothetical protein
LFKFVGLIPSCLNLSAHYVSCFLHGSKGFGIIARIPRFRVAVLGADRTFPVNAYIKSSVLC